MTQSWGRRKSERTRRDDENDDLGLTGYSHGLERAVPGRRRRQSPNDGTSKHNELAQMRKEASLRADVFLFYKIIVTYFDYYL